MNPKVAARILELMPNRIAELRANPTDDEAQHLAERLRVKLGHLRIRMAAATAREAGKWEHPRGMVVTSAATLAPSALGAEQLADLVRIAAREDMPAAVRREALAAALPQLEALRQALANTNGNGCVRSAIAPADDRGQHCDSP
ncbi:MAG: hypothetical protein JNM89_09235 [Hyphomicrobiaceae bacterium]|nr:hypothetical protein [Hyphomicrobiaceae bacterium]